MVLSLEELAKAIVGAVRPVLRKSWKDVSAFAQTEATKLAATLVNIAELKAAGKIDEAQAEALLDMQLHSMRAVLLAVQGIGLIAAQNAINAAREALKKIVNPAIGFPLL